MAEFFMRRWISCEEEMPEDRSKVLWYRPIVNGEGAMETGKYYKRSDSVNGLNRKVFNFTHWMPLPEPPQED